MRFEPTTLRVLDLEHGGSRVRFLTSPFIVLYNTNISGIGWLVGGSFMGEAFLAINVTA